MMCSKFSIWNYLVLVCTTGITFIGISPAFCQPETKNVALIVAISDYPESTGWQKLNAKNDLYIVKETLINKGFDEDLIFTLVDEEATREGILNGVNEMLLNQVEAGSIVYFHFSGHGQQVMDDDGDELDGYDEAIVPINSPQAYRPGIYEGENLVRDEDLGELFYKIREKIGSDGLLHVVLDACHSGTGTRGFAVARGTYIKMAPDNYKTNTGNRIEDQFQFSNVPDADSEDLAPMVAFFGSTHNQLNFETQNEDGENVGSLSYALSKTLSQSPPGSTYRSLFEQLKIEMNAIAPRQYPQAEGDLDVEIMSGRFLGEAMFFSVKQWNDPGSVVLNAGWLQGIQEGTIVGLYPPDTRDFENGKPYSTGVVLESSLNSSIVELEYDVDQKSAQSSWVSVIMYGFGKLTTTVSIELDKNHPLRDNLRNTLEKQGLINEAENADVFIREEGSMISLMSSQDVLISSYSGTRSENGSAGNDEISSAILRDIQRYAQCKFLKNLDLKSEQLLVKFEAVPVEYDPKTYQVTKEIPLESKLNASNQLIFKKGDVMMIRVHNEGLKPAYFSLLDIQPDNQINVLFPGPTETPAEYLIPPGRSLDVPKLIGIQPPYGREVFKLVVTDKPIDLRPISNTRGVGLKGQRSPFEELFASTYFDNEMQTRGGSLVPIPVSDVTIQTLIFDIAE